MSGMELMLKSMGLDPTEIKKQVTEFGLLVVRFNEKLDALQISVNQINERLDHATRRPDHGADAARAILGNGK